jgi:signal transduction histidine kinase
MSPEATLVSTWCAVYGFIGAYYAALWLRTSRRDPEHLTYSCMCLALAVYCLGAAIHVDASSISERSLGVRLEYAGGLSAIAFFGDFVSHLTGHPRRGVVLSSYGTTSLGLILLLGNDVLGGSPSIHWVGIVLLATTAFLGALAGMAILRRARMDPDSRVIALGLSVVVFAAIHDVSIYATRSHHSNYLPHGSLVTTLTLGFVLLRRFVRTADELEHRTRELARSYDELRKTQEELVRKEQLAAVGELSAVIAHEVRNPLAILKNAVSSFRRPTLTSTDREVLLTILDEETDRLNRLVRDLLAYARPLTPRRKLVDLEPLVVSAFEIARGGRDGRGFVRLDLELAESARTVQGDPDLLRHAFVNIIDNAVQAMPGGGRLLVQGTTTDDGTQLALAFVDTGEGMDAVVRSKALDPFFTTRPAGTGLGLAIVDRVVKSHGGSLAIVSASGQGTTITIHLPVNGGAQ